VSVKTVYTCDGCGVDSVLVTCGECGAEKSRGPGWMSGTARVGATDDDPPLALVSFFRYCPVCWSKMLSALEKVEA